METGIFQGALQLGCGAPLLCHTERLIRNAEQIFDKAKGVLQMTAARPLQEGNLDRSARMDRGQMERRYRRERRAITAKPDRVTMPAKMAVVMTVLMATLWRSLSVNPGRPLLNLCLKAPQRPAQTSRPLRIERRKGEKKLRRVQKGWNNQPIRFTSATSPAAIIASICSAV